MSESLYSNRTNLIIGFHGCDKTVADKVINGSDNLVASTNDYDWLGNGIYFWQNNEERALDWALQLSKRKNSSIKTPAVIGAIIDLGYCFDLTDNRYLKEMEKGYDFLVSICKSTNSPIPKNTNIGNSEDLLLRKLDCAVIQTVHMLHSETGSKPYDSVRGVFWEGKPIYPNAGFREKNHIQICVCNPNCKKGYFLPRSIDPNYPNP